MHYPVMTEKRVAGRWQVSLKTLRRWRLVWCCVLDGTNKTDGFLAMIRRKPQL